MITFALLNESRRYTFFYQWYGDITRGRIQYCQFEELLRKIIDSLFLLRFHGDTFQILRAGKAVKVRLHGIDTPEKAQPFGTRAQQYAGELVFGQVVTVHVKNTDRYGRLVGEVMLQDGRSVNQELVKAGMAWWYKPYAPKDTTLAQLEAEARAAKRGLWADANPVPPWAWRKR